MSEISIFLKDGSSRLLPSGSTPLDLAKSISGRLAKEALVATVNDKLVDLTCELKDGDTVNILRFEDEEGADTYRHTSAHILAQAILRLFPNTKLAIGPSIDNGFYYDIDSEHIFTEEDFPKIEAEMKNIIKEDLPIERVVLPRDTALASVEEDDIYKRELIIDLPEDSIISFYHQGEFRDLCAGCHVPSTGYVKAFKIISVAGAYWRGDSSRKMLQRIYATSFPKQGMLEEHIHRLEEAKKRDHRKLGKELELFALMDEGPGFPFLLPNGMIIKNKLLEYWRNVHTRDGYVEIETPIILNRQLWETSGHWFHYKENMYSLQVDEEDYAIKPMNCPGGMLVYKSKMRSYKDFPIRMGELGRVHRHELSGALHGMIRVRSFTQDDAHIFMLPEQIKDEIKGVANLVHEIYTTFGFKYKVELSTRPENSMGTDEEWRLAEDALQGALEELGLEYKLNPGDGAFYGPKIDFHLEDCIGRKHQCGTIQLDMQLPQRFELSYIGADNNKHKPIVIHRAIYGSIERFFAILIEHFAGKFPAWLAPEQVRIIPVTDRQAEYGKTLEAKLKNEGFRVSCDTRSEKVGYKIREGQLEKTNYMLIVGDKELEAGNVSVRSRDKGELGNMTLEEFSQMLNTEIKAKTTNLE